MFYCILLPAGVKNKKLKKRYVTVTINSYCPFLWKITIQNKDVSKVHVTPILFSKTKPETMGTVRHGLCHRLWQSAARSSTMILLATSWATMGTLGLVKFKQGGEL
jgi:hypothetical protein